MRHVNVCCFSFCRYNNYDMLSLIVVVVAAVVVVVVVVVLWLLLV